jgi:hypothetical protein
LTETIRRRSAGYKGAPELTDSPRGIDGIIREAAFPH